MAAQNEILINFKPKGDKRLIKAFNDLAKAQGKFARGTNTLSDAQEKARKRVEANNKILDKNRKFINKARAAIAQYRNSLLLFSFAMGLGIKQIAKFGQEAATVDSMSRAFGTLQGSSGNATIAINKLRAATNNTMSDFDLFQQANNAMVLGITKNSGEMAEMFDIAQRLGRALGRDTKSSVESLVTGIGRQSRLMLDNIGIIVKSDEAYEKYARRLNKSKDELTDNEKKQAFLAATMEAARAKVKRLGDEIITSQDAFDRLSAATRNAGGAIGQALMPVIEPLVKAMAKIMEAITVDRVYNVATALSFAGVTAGFASGAFNTMAASMVRATKGMLAFNKAQIRTGWGAFAAVVGVASLAIMEFFDLLGRDEIEQAAEQTEKLADETDKAAKAMERYKAVISGITSLPLLQERLEGLQVEEQITKEIVDQLDANIEADKVYEGYNKEREEGVNLLEQQNFLSMESLTNVNDLIAAETDLANIQARKAIVQQKINEAEVANEISIQNLIPNLQNQVDLLEASKKLKGAELSFEKLRLDFQARGMELEGEKGEFTKEQITQIKELLGALEDELSLRDKIKIRVKDSISGLSQVTSAQKTELSARLSNELGALKQSDDYKSASDKRRAQMEKNLNAKFAKEKSRIFKQEKLGKIAQASMNTYEAASKAWAQGGVFGGIGAAIALAAGFMQVDAIRQTQAPKFATGGLVGGRRHSQGGTLIEAEQGEFVMSRNATEAIGIENLNRMNQGGGGAVNITFTGNVMSQDFIENEAIPQIKNAIRRGADLGVS